MASQERREFDKYLKFLTQKAVQVIVQSREGGKIRTRSNPNSTDWFNLVLTDNKAIIAELKHSVDPPYPQDECPVNIEITVETPEGDSFVIEVWQIHLDTRKRDVTVSVSHVLYPRLSLILKSLLAVSRSIPSYQLSRKNEDLKFKYVLFSGDISRIPPSEDLKTVRLGEAASPFGTISVILHYRTKFSPPERIPVLPSETSIEPTNQSGSHDNSLRPLAPPLGTHFSTQPVDSNSSHQPFSSVLPRPVSLTQRTPSSEAGNMMDEEAQFIERQNSNDINSVTVRSNHDSYLVLDLNEMKPAFSASNSSHQELSDLLTLCSDPPHLDMFFEGGVDVTAACNYLDSHQSSSVLKT